MNSDRHLNIVGGGLAGALLATLLAQRGYFIDVYERRADPRLRSLDAGRSINLALAARGLAALQAAGLVDRIRPLLIPMRGRMIHQSGEAEQLLPYGSRPHEVIWSVSRAALNAALIDAAAKHHAVRLHFESACTAVDADANTLRLRTASSAAGDSDSTVGEKLTPLYATVATDGGGSAVRRSLALNGLLTVREDLLDHDYKELSIAALNGQPALDPNALHIWPRGGFMLIALPNPDHSFTVTLFLAKHANPGFSTLREPAAVQHFFTHYFPDLESLIPDRVSQFLSNPQGMLGTIHCSRWQVGRLLLLGDAAHAIVPFHGQGANCAFEDCLALVQLLDSHGLPPNTELETVFAEFERQRRPNTEAIAQMALENYTEMRDTVRDDKFVRLKALSLKLEQRHPTRFIPRYSMVMFHAEIPYAEALRRGAIQATLLDDIDQRGHCSSDFALADRLIVERLPPLPPAASAP